MVHHTAPHIPFKSSEEWNAAQAQLNGTVHCNYPQWYVFILHCTHTKNKVCIRISNQSLIDYTYPNSLSAEHS